MGYGDYIFEVNNGIEKIKLLFINIPLTFVFLLKKLNGTNKNKLDRLG